MSGKSGTLSRLKLAALSSTLIAAAGVAHADMMPAPTVESLTTCDITDTETIKIGVMAPMTGPHSVPFPPRIAINTIQTPIVEPENATSMGSMKRLTLPRMPAAMPRNSPDIVQAMTLIRLVGRPMASALSSSSRMAFTARPKRVRSSQVIATKVTIASTKAKK